MKKLLFILVLLVAILGYGQDTSSTHRFNAHFSVGASYLAPLDLSLRSSSQLTEIDSRVVGNIGLGGRWNILKYSRIKPSVELGVNFFRSKASDLDTTYLTNTVAFKNTFGSITVRGMASYQLGIGARKIDLYLGGFWNKTLLLFPYAKDYEGNEYKGFETIEEKVDIYSSSIKKGGPYYKGPKNIGFTVGAEMPYKKLRLGLFLDQRVYFEGFNREISRLSLRLVL